jgi:hypothetical protein
MIYLGKYEWPEEGYQIFSLAVCNSNVDQTKVTYHVYLEGEEWGYSREDAIEDPDCSKADRLFYEAHCRYEALGRPEAGEFEPNFKG